MTVKDVRSVGLGTLVTLYRTRWCGATGESEMGTTFAGKYPLDDADATGVLPESTPPPPPPPPCVIRFYFFQSPTEPGIVINSFFFHCRLQK